MMRRNILLILLSLAGLPALLTAQDEYPVIVSPPQTTVTVFTNWQSIKITYTIAYLDGYEPRFEEFRPEAMSFGLELDPEKGLALVRLNKRRYKNENYEDLVYYLRHIGEKKGEMIIPEQIFRYVRKEPGQSLEGLVVQETKSPAGVIRYDSVLTKNADDIMDTVDFGSFKRQQQLWFGASAATLLLAGLMLVLVFRRPVVSKKVLLKMHDKSLAVTQEALKEERLLPQEALKQFIASLKERQELVIKMTKIAGKEPGGLVKRQEIVTLANAIRRLLSAYLVEILDSDTPAEIYLNATLTTDLDDQTKQSLVTLADKLTRLDKVLYGQIEGKPLLAELGDCLKVGRDLELANSFWRRWLARCKNVWS